MEGCPHGPSQVLNSRRNLRSVDDPLRWILADLGGRPHWLSTHNRFMMRREGLQKGNSGKKATKKSELLDGRPHQGREKEEEAGGKVNLEVLVQVSSLVQKLDVAMIVNVKMHKKG